MKADCGEAGLISLILRQQQRSTHAVLTKENRLPRTATHLANQPHLVGTSRPQWVDCIVPGRHSSFKMAPVASQRSQPAAAYSLPVATTHPAAHPHSVDRLYRAYHTLKSGFRRCPSFLNKKAAFFKKKFPHLHAT
jgi:hypothetical protein